MLINFLNIKVTEKASFPRLDNGTHCLIGNKSSIKKMMTILRSMLCFPQDMTNHPTQSLGKNLSNDFIDANS